MSAPARIFLSAPHQTHREKEYVLKALDSNFVAPAGPMLDAFEQELATRMGISNCCALSSGTAALHLALHILDVGPGDEVWAPSLTFMGGISSIVFRNATPVFFDSDEYCRIDLDLVEGELAKAAAAGRLPKALIVTDLYGIASDIPRARTLCDKYGIALISDSAESLGSLLNGRAAGAGADFVVLSFNGNKIITSSGGGALLSENAAHIARARYLSQQAREPFPYYQHVEVGYNYRLSNICAAIGRAQLANLDERVAIRREIFDDYRKALGGLNGISFLEEPAGCMSNRWLSVIFIDPATGKTPEQVRLTLEKSDIESRATWKPMHAQPVFAQARYVGGLVCMDQFNTGLCLPSGSGMTMDERATVIKELKKALQ